MNRHKEGRMSRGARAYIAFVCTLGLTCLFAANWEMPHPMRFACYLLVCLVASALKVNLPGILGTMSVNFLFILIGILDLGAGQTMLLGSLGALVQCVWRPKSHIRPVQAMFSIMTIAVAVFCAYYTYHWPFAQRFSEGTPALLIACSLVYFVLNTAGVAGVVALTEKKSVIATWRSCYFWSFPFYLLGASIAWVSGVLMDRGHLQSILLLLPVIYVIYRSYRVYLGRLEDEKTHVEEMAALHLRTIEALALAIDAKDHTTHEHLSRVRTYAVELAQEMNLPHNDLEALRAAALLHDIGKLAVPEHIISKPGKLTQEEFEKMKIHPVVGAEILERVGFPYPVVPIVRSHHEKWDGSGYPDGLRGAEIPIGARILSAVDCLDALASDRQYRRALPLDQAMAEVAELAGRSFDPKVVALLQRRYVELERKAASQNKPMARLSTDLLVQRGHAPDAGFEVSEPATPPRAKEFEFLDSIISARLEAQLLFELTQDLGSSLSLDETLSVVATRLKRIVPFDAIAVYVCREGRLHPEFVNGESVRFLSSLQIPVGQGLSGWVQQTGRTVLNGNPAVESAYMNDPDMITTLRSAVAVPLVGLNGTLGVMTLYQTDRDAFSSDHVRILQAICYKVSLAMENAMKYRQAETHATTDFVTELPNARSLFLRLDSELARCKRSNEPLTVVVCDVDGFKAVNDRFGHLVGNKVLRAVGAALRDSCREYDYVARMGGDEFVLVLPASDSSSMERRIGELREIGGRASCVVPGMADMTVSIGEAFFPADGSDAEQLLAEADRRMYFAKRSAKVNSGPAPSPAGAGTCECAVEAKRSSMRRPINASAFRRGLAKIARQLAGLLVTALLGGFLTAALVRHSPGFDADERDLDARLSLETRAAIRAEHASRQDVERFYLQQMQAALHGDFGVSTSLQRPIGELIAERLPVTVELITAGVCGGWGLAFAFALSSVLWRGSAVSRLAFAASACALCLPSAAVAVLMFAVGGHVRAIVALVLFPRLHDTLRNLLQDAYERPHILTARAKGVGPAAILLRHALPICAPEFLALAGVSVVMAFAACIPVETLCDLPGLGQLAWKAATARDLPVLVVLTLLITLLTQACNAAADWVTP